MRKTALSLAVALVGSLVPVSAATAHDLDPATGFGGTCVIRGTVIPFTDFAGTGTCTGRLYGGILLESPVTATAQAVGSSVGPLPGVQTGAGTLTFASGKTISFTFTQVGTTLAITGVGGGTAVGEVVPLTTSGSTRTAQVVATTVTNIF